MTQPQYVAELAKGYSSKERTDHPQGFFPYATWLEELGNIRGNTVLDLACGSGFSSRLLANAGASVVGVDISPEMVALALEAEKEHPLGIYYTAANAVGLDLKRKFDIVTPTFLLNYARTKLELRQMISTVARHLAPGGRMVALNSPQNPIVPLLPNANHESQWIDEPFKEGSRVRLSLYGRNGGYLCAIVFNYWSPQTYEECLFIEGFDDVEWIPTRATEEGKHALSNWQQLERHNCSCVLKARKV